MAEDVDSTDATSRDRIERFRYRAAMVADSKIAQRADLATLGSTMKVLLRVGEPLVRWGREVPPVEEIEQAAARVRPVFLRQEPVYHGSVLTRIRG